MGALIYNKEKSYCKVTFDDISQHPSYVPEGFFP